MNPPIGSQVVTLLAHATLIGAIRMCIQECGQIGSSAQPVRSQGAPDRLSVHHERKDPHGSRCPG